MNYRKIVEKYKTPTYIFDIDELNSRINYLKSKFRSDIDFVYAVKANTFIIKELNDLVEKFEICSIGEFNICDDLDIDYKKMVISGVNKESNFIDKLILNHDINRYTIESLEQYKVLYNGAKKYNKRINVLIRITSGNQFGVSEDDFKYIIKNYDEELINICGIEYFSGTQKHSVKKYIREVEYLNDLVSRINDEFNFKIKEIEYGLGLPVCYYEIDEFDEDSFLDEVSSELNKLKCDKISIELGRSIAASCGYYLTSVVDMKTNKNGNFVIVDGGINHLVYYGGSLAMKTPYYEVIQDKKDEIINYNIYGSLCTVNDVLLKSININKLSIGDLFVFKKVGAYSMSEGISLFLSRDLPSVLIKKGRKISLIRDRIETSKMNFPKYK